MQISFHTHKGDCTGEPFCLDEVRRAQLRAELDAAYFHLYGLDREEVHYVLDQFQGVVKEDAATGSPGPTRQAILEAFDAMRER